MIGEEVFKACAEEAGLAPSIHNTQPARWTLEQDGTVVLKCAADAALPVADPTGHDLVLSCGAALEGFLIALSKRRLKASVTPFEETVDGPLASLRIVDDDGPVDPLAEAIFDRTTYRGEFANAPTEKQADLVSWAKGHEDIELVTDAPQIRQIALKADRLAHQLLRNADFRRELLVWSRLTSDHPHWSIDGMNAKALGLSGWQARLMPAFFNAYLFRSLDSLGAAAPLTAERDKTMSATALAFLAVPYDLPALSAGQVYYRRLLELAKLGFVTWPLSVLVDDRETQEELLSSFGFRDQRLIAAWRVGIAKGRPATKARYPVEDITFIEGTA